ncbi:hypothetical protein Taro_016104 [Colocasia esculenta]|uniref:RING-type domain-containing protein n=1 Tax=Colocasia esculenta TaxID=4460 RepID=A0A843UMX5_COLES|nr:hypothetical protein [Colocasia esculenta]
MGHGVRCHTPTLPPSCFVAGVQPFAAGRPGIERGRTMVVGAGMNLVTTAIGFGMSATFIVFLCARLICGRASSVSSPRAASAGSPAYDLEPRDVIRPPTERTINGVEPVVVAALPTVKYNRESFSSRGDAQCSICLAEYEEKEMLRIMPACGHEFHRICIDMWLQKQSTCPICRLCLRHPAVLKGAAPSVIHGASYADMDVEALEQPPSRR